MEAQKLHLETIYKEYKDYMNFLEEQAPQIKKDRENFQDFAKENTSDPKLLTQKLFEVNQKPAFYQSDLSRLQVRLVTVYDAYKDLFEIPQEIKTEVKEIKIPKNVYKIEKGKAIDIDPEYSKKIKESVEKEYSAFIQNMLKDE